MASLKSMDDNVSYYDLTKKLFWIGAADFLKWRGLSDARTYAWMINHPPLSIAEKKQKPNIELIKKAINFFNGRKTIKMQETDKAFYFYTDEISLKDKKEKTINKERNVKKANETDKGGKKFQFSFFKFGVHYSETYKVTSTTISYKKFVMAQIQKSTKGRTSVLYYIPIKDFIDIGPKQLRLTKPEAAKPNFKNDYKQYFIDQSQFNKKAKEIIAKMKRGLKKIKKPTTESIISAFKMGKKPGYDPLPFHNQIIEKDHPVYGKLRY